MRKERNGLVEGVSRLDVGEDEHVGLAIDGRHNALDVTTGLLARGLHVQRSINDDVAELTRLGQLDDVHIIQRMGELGADLLRTMYQGNAGLLDAKVTAGANGVPDHLDALLKRGPRNNGSIGEEQQLVVRGYLHHGQMRQHLALGQ